MRVEPLPAAQDTILCKHFGLAKADVREFLFFHRFGWGEEKEASIFSLIHRTYSASATHHVHSQSIRSVCCTPSGCNIENVLNGIFHAIAVAPVTVIAPPPSVVLMYALPVVELSSRKVQSRKPPPATLREFEDNLYHTANRQVECEGVARIRSHAEIGQEAQSHARRLTTSVSERERQCAERWIPQ